MNIIELLTFAIKNNASDLHLSAGMPPLIRVDGEIRRINVPHLEQENVQEFLYDTMNEKQQREFEEHLEIDFSYEIENLARFRVNAFHQKRGISAVFRTIPSKVLSMDELNMGQVFKNICDFPRGHRLLVFLLFRLKR